MQKRNPLTKPRRAPPAPPCMRPPLPTDLQPAFPSPAACFSMAGRGRDLPCLDAGSGGASSSLLAPILHGRPWMRPPLPWCGLQRWLRCGRVALLRRRELLSPRPDSPWLAVDATSPTPTRDLAAAAAPTPMWTWPCQRKWARALTQCGLRLGRGERRPKEDAYLGSLAPSTQNKDFFFCLLYWMTFSLYRTQNRFE